MCCSDSLSRSVLRDALTCDLCPQVPSSSPTRRSAVRRVVLWWEHRASASCLPGVGQGVPEVCIRVSIASCRVWARPCGLPSDRPWGPRWGPACPEASEAVWGRACPRVWSARASDSGLFGGPSGAPLGVLGGRPDSGPASATALRTRVSPCPGSRPVLLPLTPAHWDRCSGGCRADHLHSSQVSWPAQEVADG